MYAQAMLDARSIIAKAFEALGKHLHEKNAPGARLA
jgi:hypothetical protein